jgi:hypothetical protein
MEFSSGNVHAKIDVLKHRFLYSFALTGLACIAAVVLWVTYFWPQQDVEAELAAEAFCTSFVIGEELKGLDERAQNAGASLLTWGPEAGVTRHAVLFSGFLANRFECGIREAGGVITNKSTDKHTW